MKAQAQKGFTLIELMIVVAIIGILAAIAITQYQNYVARSQAARVMSEAGTIKTAVEACVLDGRVVVGLNAGQCDPGATGSSLLVGATQGSPIPANTGVPQVTINADGTATIAATFGNSAATTLAADTLTWSRTVDGSWQCASTIDAKFRPTGCTN